METKNPFKVIQNKVSNQWESFKETRKVKKCDSSFKFRICNYKKDNEYVDGLVNEEEHKIYFYDKAKIAENSVLVDELEHLYLIKRSRYGQNIYLSNKSTTICEYEDFILKNKLRIVDQEANIHNTIGEIHVNADNGSEVKLDFESIAYISQKIETRDLVSSIEEEMNYSYKPYKNKETIFNILEKLAKGLSLDEIESKIIETAIKEAGTLVKKGIRALLEKIRSKS